MIAAQIDRCNAGRGTETAARERTGGLPGGSVMAKMCPIDGCRAKSGLCIHDKMMIGMGFVGLCGSLFHFGLRLF